MTDALEEYDHLVKENPIKYREFEYLYKTYSDLYWKHRKPDIPTAKAIIDWLLENDYPLIAENYRHQLSKVIPQS